MSDTTENNKQLDAAGPASPPSPAQSVAGSADRRWGGRKTAVVAACALLLGWAGAAGAAAALPRVEGQGDLIGPGRVLHPPPF